jgi:hypothetical protein
MGRDCLAREMSFNRRSIMITPLPLRDHPRLLASANHLGRLRRTPKLPFLSHAHRSVIANARQFTRSRDLVYNPGLHNALLLRAREMQTRVITLLARWRQTEEAAYRQAAIEDIRDMGLWKDWSSFQEGWNNHDPKCAFDLSYGENSATVALAYDWLYHTLSEEERELFKQIALKRSLEPFLARTEEGRREWWFGAPHTNWNTVCAGGAGMLALAMHDELAEAAEVLKRVELSLPPYMESLNGTEGGWAEGIGYWNYGHRYAFWYLLSHEQATGRPHPLMLQPGVRQTLDFPLDFCPNGQPCSFGDVNGWAPLAFHYAVAERFKRHDVVARLDAYVKRAGPSFNKGVCWPNEVEMLIFHSGKSSRPPKAKLRVMKRYPGMDFCFLADRMPEPRLYLSIRGGTTEAPHGHTDPLSFHAVVGQERLIDNIGINGGDEYLDTTFSSRRFDLFETRPDSKNTIFINGVGIRKPSVAPVTLLKGKDWNGIRLDATAAMSHSPTELIGIKFCGRLFLMLDGPLALILDRVVLPQPGRMETRMHTYSRVRFFVDKAEIRGKREQLNLAFASSVPAGLHRAEGAHTTPRLKSTMVRWCTDTRTHKEVTFATLLTPGPTAAQVVVEEFPRHVLVRIRHRGKIRRFKISNDLRKVAAA